MASDIWLRTILIVRKETRCRHSGYTFRLAAFLLYAPSHRQDSTYHGLCYTSRGALAVTRNSSMAPPHEGSIRRPIAPWANALTTELHLALDGESETTTKQTLLERFHNSLSKFRRHVYTIRHQCLVYRELWRKLPSSECIIHIDVSENFSCKFGSEIKSVHFGGSHIQVTLHTGVLYVGDVNQPISLCTLYTVSVQATWPACNLDIPCSTVWVHARESSKPREHNVL